MSRTETKLISVAEAANLLALTRASIRRLLKEGRLRGEMIGSQNVIDRASVDEEFAARYPDFQRREEE